MRRATRLSIVAGTWSTLWVALPPLAYAGLDARATAQLALTLDLFTRKIGLHGSAFIALAALVTGVAVFTSSLLLLALAGKFDPARRTMAALSWVKGTLPCGLLWAAATCAAMVLTHVLPLDGALAVLGTALCMAIYALAPFLCLRGDIVAMQQPPIAWLPQWPGMAAVALGLLVVASDVLLDLASDAYPTSGMASNWFAAAVLGWLGWFVGLLLRMLTLAAWRSRLRWRALRPFLQTLQMKRSLLWLAAADLRLLWLLLAWVVVPTICIALHAIFVIPEIEAGLVSISSTTSHAYAAIGSVSNWVGTWWWIGAMLLFWPLLAWTARIAHLAQEPP